VRQSTSARSGPAGPVSERCDDAALVAMVVRGSERALGLLYDRHVGAVQRMGGSILWNAEATQDLVQDTFVALWRHGERYSSARGSVRSWLLTIARNRAIDALRAQEKDRRRVEAAHEAARVALPLAGPLAEVIARDEAGRLRAALAEISPAQHDALLLAYWGGLTHEEVAHRTEVPLGTAKSRIRVGQEGLARLLDPGPALERPAT
jgi:RNA polymerase sigma-70 factor (ECF subfamily)